MGIAPEVRWRTSPFMARTIFPDLSVGYDIGKQVSVTGHYRYVYTNEGMGNYTINHKVMLDGNYRKKFDKLQFGFRLRLGTIEDENPDPELLQIQTWEVREKFSLTGKLHKKLEGFVSCEFFQSPVEGWTEMQQLRLVLGTEYAFNKRHQLQLGLMFQDRPDVKRLNPVITYSVDVDKLVKKKNDKKTD